MTNMTKKTTRKILHHQRETHDRSGVVILFGSLCDGGKILVLPVEGSHWVNMDILIKALHGQGHSIDVIRTYNSWFVKENSTYYNSITIPNTKGMDEEFVDNILFKMIDYERGKSQLSALQLLSYVSKAIHKTHEMICQLITNIFESAEILKTLKEKQYDLILTDPSWGAGIILAHELKLPMVYNVRWTATGEGHFDVAPSPISYIPITGSGNTDKMNFFQRGADIWLMRVDFVFEFPRPTMPNIIYIGGFQCKPAKALPHDLEDFMQSSGEHGVIIMSLGSFISVLPDDFTAEIATAFAQLPQKEILQITAEAEKPGVQLSSQSSLLEFTGLYYGLTPHQVRKFAYELAVKYNLKYPQTWGEKQVAAWQGLTGSHTSWSGTPASQ
ncbi:unnamed protein product [Leuciscus chuanchicus]